MGILIMTLGGCFLILAILLVIVWRKTDWKRIDEANKMFYDSDGNHVYYDRARVRMKEEAAMQRENER